MPVLRPREGESTKAPATFSQPSRKGKKAWRKNVDVTEVQQGLRDLNDQLIEGCVFLLCSVASPPSLTLTV